MNTENLIVGDLQVEVRRKGIRNLHVGVYPPLGNVRVSAPDTLSLDAIRTAVLVKMTWIRRKQSEFLKQERQSPRRYVSGETHYLFGQACRLSVTEWDKPSHKVSREGSERLVLMVPAGCTSDEKKRWLKAWYRTQLRRAASPRVSRWAGRLHVEPASWGIRDMKTKWGSCNSAKRIIWLNSELIHKPLEALDYVIVHELAHLISPKHDDVFLETLDTNFARWRQVRSELNALPLPTWQD